MEECDLRYDSWKDFGIEIKAEDIARFGRLREILTEIARQDAHDFFDEFEDALDVDETDWDAVAWSLSAPDWAIDNDAAFRFYQRVLVETTRKLANLD